VIDHNLWEGTVLAQIASGLSADLKRARVAAPASPSPYPPLAPGHRTAPMFRLSRCWATSTPPPKVRRKSRRGARTVRRAPPRDGVYQESRALERGVERGSHEVGVRNPARPELLRRRTRDAPSAQRPALSGLSGEDGARHSAPKDGARRVARPKREIPARREARAACVARAPRRAWGGDLQTGGAIGAVRGLRGGGGGSLQGALQPGGTARVLSWRA
jgi:hypothetical protein